MIEELSSALEEGTCSADASLLSKRSKIQQLQQQQQQSQPKLGIPSPSTPSTRTSSPVRKAGPMLPAEALVPMAPSLANMSAPASAASPTIPTQTSVVVEKTREEMLDSWDHATLRALFPKARASAPMAPSLANIMSAQASANPTILTQTSVKKSWDHATLRARFPRARASAPSAPNMAEHHYPRRGSPTPNNLGGNPTPAQPVCKYAISFMFVPYTLNDLLSDLKFLCPQVPTFATTGMSNQTNDAPTLDLSALLTLTPGEAGGSAPMMVDAPAPMARNLTGMFVLDPAGPSNAAFVAISEQVQQQQQSQANKLRVPSLNSGSTTSFIVPQIGDILCGKGRRCTDPHFRTLIERMSMRLPAGRKRSKWRR